MTALPDPSAPDFEAQLDTYLATRHPHAFRDTLDDPQNGAFVMWVPVRDAETVMMAASVLDMIINTSEVKGEILAILGSISISSTENPPNEANETDAASVNWKMGLVPVRLDDLTALSVYATRAIQLTRDANMARDVRDALQSIKTLAEDKLEIDLMDGRITPEDNAKGQREAQEYLESYFGVKLEDEG